MHDFLHVEQQLTQQMGRKPKGNPAARSAVMPSCGASPEPGQSRRCAGRDGPMQDIEQLYDGGVAAEAAPTNAMPTTMLAGTSTFSTMRFELASAAAGESTDMTERIGCTEGAM